MAIDYQARIPNNVDLSNDRGLQRALEHWQPAFLDWWKELGPDQYQGHEIYLRTGGASSWPTARKTERSASATSGASLFGNRCRPNIAQSCVA